MCKRKTQQRILTHTHTHTTYIQRPLASFVTLVSIRIDDFASEYKLCARVNIPLITGPI